ncbi:MAG: radical SAM protein [Candidatus Thermoplasmatota archaeon]|nr:radical SAM protein [Candidatus Thermoplasmatota archaeon]
MRVCEIFLSLQGEGLDAGLPTVFVRLSGCNLRCSYCDTQYAFCEGEEMREEEIVDRICGLGCKRVCITGGEPLLQDISPLSKKLRAKGFWTKLETNGSLPLAGDFDVVDMDIKTPSSGESGKMKLSSIKSLGKKDELKFVISDREDYDYSKSVIKEFEPGCNIIFQPAYGALKPEKLAEWMIEDRLEARLGIQLHKLLWGERKGV